MLRKGLSLYSFYYVLLVIIIPLALTADSNDAKPITGHVIHDIPSSDDFSYLGWIVKSARDVNQDGFPDILTNKPGRNYREVHVYSGFDGSLLYNFDRPGNDVYYGRSIAAAGDLNDDGHPDILIGVPGFGTQNNGQVEVRSGIDGQVLQVINGFDGGSRFGHAVARIKDINGDRVPDIVVGAPAIEQTVRGKVYIFSGATFQLLKTFDSQTYSVVPPGSGPSAHFGFEVGDAGDLNGDGIHDVMVGAPRDSTFGLAWGSVLFISGANGNLIHKFSQPGATNFGEVIVKLGDLNRNGFPEFGVKNLRSGGFLWVYEYNVTSILRYHTDDVYSLSRFDDFNGDGFPDFLVGDPYCHLDTDGDGQNDTWGVVSILSGLDFSTLWSRHYDVPDNRGDLFGWSVAKADFDQDGKLDVLLGAPEEDHRHKGRVLLLKTSALAEGPPPKPNKR